MPRPSAYQFIDSSELPEEVWEELSDAKNMSNDMGKIVNPVYHPLFKTWLQANGHPITCYILWASW